MHRDQAMDLKNLSNSQVAMEKNNHSRSEMSDKQSASKQDVRRFQSFNEDESTIQNLHL